MRKLSLVTLMILISLLVVSRLYAASSDQSTFNLKFHSIFPAVSSVHKFNAPPILDEITKQSNGRITFTMYPGGVLGGGDEEYDVVKTGKADITYTPTGYVPGRFPLSEVFTLPGAFKTNEAMIDVALAVFDKILYKEFTNVHCLSMFRVQDFYLYTVKKPIRTLEDAKGLKLRSSGGLVTPTIQALQAAPIFMSPTDLYLSAKTGVVDGAISGLSANLAFKLQEVYRHELLLPMGALTYVWIVNSATWAKLPDDLKGIMQRVARKAGYGQINQTAQDAPIMSKALIDSGGSSYTLPPNEEKRWIDAFTPAVNTWVKGLEAKKLPIKEVMDITREECKKRNVPFPY